jgi:hypothetical protein
VTLIRGTVEVLPIDMRFDAATCLFVLHFLTDVDKLARSRSGIAVKAAAEFPAFRPCYALF